MNYNYYDENENRIDLVEVTQQEDERRRPGDPDRPPGGPGFPPGGPGFPPGGPGFEPPRSAPPSFTPLTPRSAVDLREIRRCLNRFTFIWLRNGESFWFFPVFVSRDFVLGFRWGRRGWDFTQINLRRILFFQCQ